MAPIAASRSTAFAFTLPYGFQDDTGALHRDGVMRLAKAIDEIEPLQDPRVVANQAYLTVVLLSRVITRLGTFSPISTALVEQLYAADFAFLQDLYVRLNEAGSSIVQTQCPSCSTRFSIDVSGGNNG
jgi:hypothetical protein